MEAPNPSVEGVFADFKERREALIKALTTDKDKLFQMCDPEKPGQCLFGHSNGSWEVRLPFELLPPNLPEPLLGVNFARDGMQNKEWRLWVADHSDSWLLSVAFYFSGCFGFGNNEKGRLFQMISELPTVNEVVNEEAEPEKDQTGNQKGFRRKPSKKMTKLKHRIAPPSGLKAQFDLELAKMSSMTPEEAAIAAAQAVAEAETAMAEAEEAAREAEAWEVYAEAAQAFAEGQNGPGTLPEKMLAESEEEDESEEMGEFVEGETLCGDCDEKNKARVTRAGK